jgi:hypothetical protein
MLRDMTRISDALELLTAQHAELDALVADVVAAGLDPQARARTLGELADKLTTHLAVEQELFYPSIGSVGARTMVMTEVIAEHVEIKRALADLLWIELDDADWLPRLTRLRDLLAGHTGWQEDILFEAVARTMSSESLAEIGEQLRERSQTSLCLAA